MSAVRVARAATKRDKIIKFEGCYHGHADPFLVQAGSGAMTLGVPTSPGVPAAAARDTLLARYNDVESVERLAAQHRGEIAALFVEPIAGNMGLVPPQDGFLQGLRTVCSREGILLVFDEVQSGVGRTGKLFCAEHEGVTPDIMTLAKGLGSGLPIGAVVAKAGIMKQWKKGAHGNTFGGNPISCAAANATIDLVREQYAANAAKVGAHFMKRLHEMRADYPCIGDIRGRGLMIGVEMIDEDGSPARAMVDRLLHRAYHNGLLLLSCGVSTLRFMPPLSVTEAEVDESLIYLRQSLDEALAGQA
jgi:4-aminobutyrate aminotransferase